MYITLRKMSFTRDKNVLSGGRACSIALVAVCAACTLSNPSPIDTTRLTSHADAVASVTTSMDYRRIESEVVRELNAVRADPSGYSTYLADLVPRYTGTVLHKDGTSTGVRTTEGADATKEAIGSLRMQTVVPSLSFNSGLAAAARDLALDQARTGAVGHTGSDGSSPANRLARHGTWSASYNENVDYGRFATGRDVVIDLLIDDGVADRGHRRNIFDPTARVVGVACAPHPKYGSVCVIDQAGGFAAR